MKTPRWLLPALVLLLTPVPVPAAPPQVTVGSKNFTESVILGEIIAHLVRNGGGEAVHRAELGGTQILWKALLAGEIDVYAEYTGTISQEILAGQPLRDDESFRKALSKYGVRMSAPLGFNDSYALGMKEENAAKLKISSISDLKDHPELKIGLSDEFMERRDGWPGLQTRYQLNPHQSVDGMDHNLAYRGLDGRSIDVTDLYTTDPEIKYYGLRVLEDDLHYFPQYRAVLLYRAGLPTRAPGVMTALKKLEGLIDNKAMIEINARVQQDRVEEWRVAAEFLNDKLKLEIPIPVETTSDQFWRAVHRFLQRTWQHLFLVGVSLTLAIVLALPLGVVAYKRPAIGEGILGVVGIIQTIPSMAVLVFMIPLLGLGGGPAIVALFLYSLLPIVRNTYTGLRDIPPSLHESALVLGLPPAARLRLVELPMASRSILAGIKTAAVINVGTATIGALIGAGGYGQPILTGIRLNNISLILQGAIPAAVLALLVQGLFELAERTLVSRGLRLQAGG
jgi:osmoprotectant transport system permease protein